LNPSLTPTEFDAELARVRLDALVLPGWLDAPVRKAVESKAIGLLEATKAVRSFSDITLRPARDVPAPSSNGDAPSPSALAVALKSSGTTGPSKLIRVTHSNLLEMASKMQRWFGLSSDDRCAALLPFYYANGLKTSLVVPLLLGGSIAIPATPLVTALEEWGPDLRPTWFSTSPNYLQATLERFQSDHPKAPHHSLRFILCSSSYLPDLLRSRLEALLGIPILEFYGLSEAGMMAANPAPPAMRKPGTAGLTPSGELAIRDANGDILTRGQVGEVVVR